MTTTTVDYSKRIFYLIVGLLVAGAVAAVIVFGSVLPARRDRDRIRHNSEQMGNAIACDNGFGDDC